MVVDESRAEYEAENENRGENQEHDHVVHLPSASEFRAKSRIYVGGEAKVECDRKAVTLGSERLEVMYRVFDVKSESPLA